MAINPIPDFAERIKERIRTDAEFIEWKQSNIEAGTVTGITRDGTEVRFGEDGSQCVTTRDKTQYVYNPNTGSICINYSNGDFEVYREDGFHTMERKDGSATVWCPDGTRRDYPNGLPDYVPLEPPPEQPSDPGPWGGSNSDGTGKGGSMEGAGDDFDKGKGDDNPAPAPDPLMLDLNGDGIKTISASAGAFFDHDGDGFAEQTGWVDANDGLLVMDRNGDGVINDGKELFGDHTVLSNGRTASNGFAALADLDSNHDGKIDANDEAFSQLIPFRSI